ncbi:MAG: glycosyltransferase [Betaproteobacteria bacterium]|nr:glycosyltransferase [Betaproteobacteria bacterium]
MQPPPLKSAETNFQEIETRGHPNIKVHDVALAGWLWQRHMPLDKLFKKAYYSLAARGHAKRLIAAHAIDVVLLYNIPQYRFSSLPGVAIVFDYADDYVDMLAYELGKLNNPLARWLARQMLERMMKRATVTLSVSNVLAQQAEGNVNVLPNGVSLEKAATVPLVPIQPVNGGGKKVIGFLGAFEYFIDLDLMVEVAKAMPDLHFLMVGSGRGWKHVAARVTGEKLTNVQLTGGVPHDQVFAYIREMDVCLNIFTKLPVSHRACPIKLFEYLSQKKPVVTTRLDELAHIDRGFLYYGDTRDEVVAAIRDILNDPAKAAARADQGYELTADQYTWNRIGEQFSALVVPRLEQRA